MADMLVNLLRVPGMEEAQRLARGAGVVLRRAQPFELSAVRGFVAERFAPAWADEVSVGFANKPVSVYLATRDGRIVGFAAYECTRRAFFGPTAVLETERGRGIGKALLLACLQGLADMGYVYGIIGGVGPAEFYVKAVGAMPIPDSTPGIYVDKLKERNDECSKLECSIKSKDQ